MQFQSLKSKLLLAVSVLVIVSGILISLLFTQRYSNSLLQSMTVQAENLAHAVELEATDKILTNDLVALQKMLDYRMRSNSAISYLFVMRDHHILAHTFTNGVPVDLIRANDVSENNSSIFKNVASMKGDHYLDIAWPIFSGKAGVLRLGISEKPYREQVNQLWIQMSVITLGILVLALVVSLFFIKRITRPLSTLSKAAEKIDEGHLEIDVPSKDGRDEVGKLTSSFNGMVTRINNYTQRLEEIGRAHV